MSNNKKFNYSLPSGFTEFNPSVRALELNLLESIRRVAELYGFCSVETPLVERMEVLQAKGNQGDNLIYAISPIIASEQDNRVDDGNEARGLRFDQTVPLAAYIARHMHELNFPFSRYQMDFVFRGERPKKGRFRSFKQCDFDVVGKGSLDLYYDALMPAMINDIFNELKIGNFVIRISNRKILSGYFESLGLGADVIKSCIKVVDQLDKIPIAKLEDQFFKLGVSSKQIEELSTVFLTGESGIEAIKSFKVPSNLFDTGVAELEQVMNALKSMGVKEDRFVIDLKIARGLGYYTGTVYETTLVGYDSIGSICSGGRYDDLVGIFAGQALPGVGISIGWTRLFSNLIENNLLPSSHNLPAKVMVLPMDRSLVQHYLSLASELRRSGINTLSNFDYRSIGKQFNWAQKQGIIFCLLIGTNELEDNLVTVKRLDSGDQQSVKRNEIVNFLKEALSD